MVDPKIGSWNGNTVTGVKLDATTYGQGSSYPSTWDTGRLFWRTDLESLYQNTGTESVPVWTSLQYTGTLVERISTAVVTTPTKQTGLMDFTMNPDPITTGDVIVTVDSTATVYDGTDSQFTAWYKPTSSITIETRDTTYDAQAGSPSVDHSESEANVTGLSVASDGIKFYSCSSNIIKQWTCSTANDISTMTADSKTFDTAPTGTTTDIQISADGTKIYYLDQIAAGSDYIRQRTLTTAYDITTASAVTGSLALTGSDDHYGLSITPDGLYVVVTGVTSTTVTVYGGTMSSAWDITTTGTFDTTGVTGGQSYYPRGISIAADGYDWWMIDINDNLGWKYRNTTAFDMSTASMSTNFDAMVTDGLGNETNCYAIETSDDGKVTWMAGSTKDVISQWDSSNPFAGYIDLKIIG